MNTTEIADATRKFADHALLVGIPEKGSVKGRVRLWLRPEKDWYIEFDAAAVTHRVPVPAGSSFAGASLIWVTPGTRLAEIRSTSEAEQAAFLRGTLFQERTQGALEENAMAMALPATVVASSLPCATVAVTVTVTLASLAICTTSVNTPPLNSALMHQQCVTTNATVICHPQTRTMTGGDGGCGAAGGGAGGGDKGPVLT